MSSAVGIIGIGLFLPEEVRTNDYWAKQVPQWRERLVNLVPRNETAVGEHTEGTRRTLAALAEVQDDPFQGARERRVMAADMVPSDMEAAAAREALAHAHLAPDDIDLLLTHSMVPDYLNVNQASILQSKLGVRSNCLSFGIEAVCTSFPLQLMLAEQSIASGRARYALLTQSSACTRIMPEDQPFSAWVGDAATAVVVGPVEHGRGLLGMSFRSDGGLHGAFVGSVPGKRYYEDGRVVACVVDKQAARRMQLIGADTAREVVGEALAKAGVKPEEVDFYASHQPSVWFRRVTQEYCGLVNARAVETFPWAGSVNSANIGLQLALGVREGLIKAGSTIALFVLASGMSTASTVLRWNG